MAPPALSAQVSLLIDAPHAWPLQNSLEGVVPQIAPSTSPHSRLSSAPIVLCLTLGEPTHDSPSYRRARLRRCCRSRFRRRRSAFAAAPCPCRPERRR